jgi:hypothetical protein
MTAWDEQNLYQRFVERRQVDMEKEKGRYSNVIEEIVEYLRPDLTGNTDSDIGKQMGTSIVEGTAHFDAPYSNFYEVNNHFVLDGVTVGSPVMLTEEDVQNNRRVCTLPHYTESFLMRDWFGEDIAYHRKWKVSNIAAMQAFGKENLPDATQNEIRQGTLDTKHEYLMCIARAADPIFQGLRPEFEIPLIRPWMQLWFAVDGLSVNEKKPLNYTLLKRGEEAARRPDGSTIQMPTSSPGYWQANRPRDSPQVRPSFGDSSRKSEGKVEVGRSGGDVGNARTI